MELAEKNDYLVQAYKYILDFYYGNVSYETIDTVLGHELSIMKRSFEVQRILD